MKLDTRAIKIVYLCGPIDAVSAEESKGWRTIAYDKLSQLAVVSTVPGLEVTKMTPDQIVRLDSHMIRLSDAVIANLNFLSEPPTRRIGTGTLVEIGMAFAQGKKIIAYSELPLHNSFFFLRGLCKPMYTSLAEAIAVVEDVNEGRIPY